MAVPSNSALYKAIQGIVWAHPFVQMIYSKTLNHSGINIHRCVARSGTMVEETLHKLEMMTTDFAKNCILSSFLRFNFHT